MAKKKEYLVFKSIYFIVSVLILIYLTACNKNNQCIPTEDKEILKIGETCYMEDDFEKNYMQLNHTSILSDSLIHKTLLALFNKALIISYLKEKNYRINNEEQNILNYQNRIDLVKLAIKENVKNITVKKSEIKREYKRYNKKQIIVDYIWLPNKNKQIIKKYIAFLNSGGSLSDLINSENGIFTREIINNKEIIVFDNKEIIERINVKPGMFSNKISTFISNGKIGDIKLIKTKSGFHIVKIIQKKTDPFVNLNKDDIEFNLKKTKYFKTGSLFQLLIKQNKLKYNYYVLNTFDFSVNPLFDNDDIIGEFNGKKVYLDDLKKDIDNLPFDYKILFSNTNCKSSAVATLILLNNSCKPVTSKELFLEILTGQNSSENNYGNEKLIFSKNSDPVSKQLIEKYKKYFEYQLFTMFEKSDIYPWLFPTLFKEFDKVKINYNVVYKNQLVKTYPFDEKEILAFYKDSVYKTEDFLRELNIVSFNSLSEILQLENAKRVIYYHFSEKYGVPSSKVIVNKLLLKNVLLDYSRELEIQIFTENILSKSDVKRIRELYNRDTVIAEYNNSVLTVGNLRELVSQFPLNKQLTIKEDYFNDNKFWRLNAINELIEEEIWLKEAYSSNLQNLQEYNNIKKNNEQNIIITSFLNSFNKQKFEILNNTLNDIIKESNNELHIFYDTVYFKDYVDILNSTLVIP